MDLLVPVPYKETLLRRRHDDGYKELTQARRLAKRTAYFFNNRCVEIGDTETLFNGGAQNQSTTDYLEGRFG